MRRTAERLWYWPSVFCYVACGPGLAHEALRYVPARSFLPAPVLMYVYEPTSTDFRSYVVLRVAWYPGQY
eukprot:3708150-Rhodomonas_salina.3